MAYQPHGGGFGNIVGGSTQDQGYGNIFRDMLSSYAGGLANSNLPNEIEQKNRRAALEESLLQSQVEKNKRYGSLGGDFSGDAGNAFRLALLEQQLGPNDPRVIAVKQAIELQQEGQRGLIDYRQQLSESAPKRFSTTQGKLLQERAEAEAGYRPGSDYTQPISGEEREKLVGQYDNALLKNTTDSDTRKRSLFAANIDKTLESFDVKDIARYAGVAGAAEKKLQQGKALTGKEDENFRKFEDAMVSVEVLAKQMRQFYGDSISPTATKHLEEITNPATWMNNPVIAERKFNALRRLLENETKTFKNALKNTSEYGGDSSTSQNESDPLGLFD